MSQSPESMTLRVFPDLSQNYKDESRIAEKAVLTTRHERLQFLNKMIGSAIQEHNKKFLCAYITQEAKADVLSYPVMRLDALPATASIPDHELTLEKGCVVRFICNFLPKNDIVYKTRYYVDNMTNNVLYMRDATKNDEDKRLILPYVFCGTGNDDFPIPGLK